MLKSGRLVPGGVFVFLLSFFLASSSVAAGPDWGAQGGAIPPVRPGSLNAVPDPKLLPSRTQAAPAPVGTVLTTKGFVFASSLGATDTAVVQFPVPGPGTVILEASNTQTPLAKLGLIARAPKPPGQTPVDTRWDGPTPLRAEFPVTAQDLANLAPQGNVWTVFITRRGPNGVLYAIPGLAAVGELKVSFVASAPAQQPVLQSKTVPNLGGIPAGPARAVATKAAPAGTPQASPGASPPVATAPQAAQSTEKAGNPAAPKTSQPPIAAANTIEPTWPQPFELGPGEQTGFGFVAGPPGLIVVNVRWTGVPLTVSLAKPGGGSIDQQGNGSVTLQYNATADDVRKGVLWGVGIRPTQVALKPATGTGITVIEKPVKIDTRGLTKGTVSVQHPPGDMNLAQAELKARVAKAQALQPTSQPAATATVNVLAQRQAALQKQQTVRQAALLEQIRSKIPVPAYQEMSQRIALGTAASGVPLMQKSGVAFRATGTSAQSQVTNAGSNAPATIAVDPVITTLSVTSGQPGDPILITGSGFSNDPGEVHFIVANGKDVAAPVTVWSDTQILAAVPDVSGIQAFNGLVYVKRGTPKSQLVPFRFDPSIECRSLGVIGIQDKTIQNTNESYYYVNHPVSGWAFFLGARGDDQFFSNTRLKNGWTFQAVYLTHHDQPGIGSYGAADAYVSESSPGTDSLSAKVHWWIDAGASVYYTPVFEISGPKGVPHF